MAPTTIPAFSGAISVHMKKTDFLKKPVLIDRSRYLMASTNRLVISCGRVMIEPTTQL